MAIMLGRLQMDIDECINEYSNLVDTVAQNSKPRVIGAEKVQRRFVMVEMKKALIEIISRCGFEKEALFYEPKAKCKV